MYVYGVILLIIATYRHFFIFFSCKVYSLYRCILRILYFRFYRLFNVRTGKQVEKFRLLEMKVFQLPNIALRTEVIYPTAGALSEVVQSEESRQGFVFIMYIHIYPEENTDIVLYIIPLSISITNLVNAYYNRVENLLIYI